MDMRKVVCKSFLVTDFFLWLDTFQLVSVKLTKTAGQDVEAKEFSVVLEGVDASPKCTAFGREVYSPLVGSVGYCFVSFPFK